MRSLPGLLQRAEAAPYSLSREELAWLLRLGPGKEREAFHAAACRVRDRVSGPNVYLRGLLEIGSVCRKNCYYCGLRSGNPQAERYRLSGETIIESALQVFRMRIGSVVLQSGEIDSPEHTAFIENIVHRIREETSPDFAIVLSLGEQSEESYARWRAAGATRYLLRVETSSPALYAKLHPEDHLWRTRVDCLRALRRQGYQVGTGVMIGLPGQSLEDLADDILFFREVDADMIGMGPFLPHLETPMKTAPASEEERLCLAVNMVAAVRLYLHTCNVAATTALQALAEDGRERALCAGANVLMPNFTDIGHRRAYRLYPGKPVVDEISGETPLQRLCASIEALGMKVAWNVPGTPPHFRA